MPLFKFQEGGLVFPNLHSLFLLRNKTGCGRKLLMKYNGPFKIIQKLSAVFYQLWVYESYRIPDSFPAAGENSKSIR